MAPEKERWRKERVIKLLSETMHEFDLNCWLVLTRENNRDPLAWDVGLEHAVLAAAGIFVHRDGVLERTAVVANFDTTPVEASGVYERIVAYGSEGALPHIREVLEAADPELIGVNVSEVSPIADGLTVGLRGYLERAIGPELAERLVGAEEMVAAFRCRRLPQEIEHYREAVATTEEIVRGVLASGTIVPGETTERDVAEAIQARTREMGLGPAWAEGHCPNVWTRQRGHGGPTGRVIERGDIVSVDFGIDAGGYLTDIQRTAYVLREGEEAPPPEIAKLWATVVAANSAAVAAMRPGATGQEVDAAARAVVVECGYEEYGHATGHPVGFCGHEIGPLLGPDWPDRYGTAVFRELEAGQIYAVEPAVSFTRDGERIGTGLEEEVLVTEKGAEYLSQLQSELILVR